MSYGRRVLAEPLRSLGFASIGATYTAVGGPFDFPVRMLVFKNCTDMSVLISFDGVTDNEIIPATTFIVFDFGTNRMNPDGFFMAEGTQVYVKQGPDGAPTKSALYVSTFYGKGD